MPSRPASLPSLAVSQAILHLGPQLEELDVNPLWVRDSQVEALDALFVWRSTEVAAQRVAAH